MEATNNANQKEKFEADLKKEIKKLQVNYLRNWLDSPDGSDTSTRKFSYQVY